jgi:hypothetical protein
MIRRRRAATIAVVLGLGLAVPVAGHSPDPFFNGPLYAQNQELRFRWKAGEAPPAAMQTAIKLGAADANATRNSRAAVFIPDANGLSWINYGLNVACGVNGLACFSRAGAPKSFTMSFRENGHRYDWGVLHWCEMSGYPNGCFEARNSALDEFGHVEILHHHVNFADESDFLDAVVQTIQRVKPEPGYNAHAFGRCDVATLQRKYDMPTMAWKYSTCLDLSTELTLTAPAWVPTGGTITFSANLKVADLPEYERLGANPVSGRAITLQRRFAGGAWLPVGQLSPATADGTYAYSATGQTATAEWRAVFAKPAAEGLRGDTSAVLTVAVLSCGPGPCPQAPNPTTAR